jgi:hypothetical protein
MGLLLMEIQTSGYTGTLLVRCGLGGVECEEITKSPSRIIPWSELDGHI